MKKRHLGLCMLLLAAALFLCPATTAAATDAPAARHIILFIGDGMQRAHEIAASRYLTGQDNGLAWHSFPAQLHVTTWDINTYNAYADRLKRKHFDEGDFDPLLGYDPAKGGAKPYPFVSDEQIDLSYFLEFDPGDIEHRRGRGPATDSASSATAFSSGRKTTTGSLAWRAGDVSNPRLDSIAALMRAQRGAAIGVVSTVPFNHATPAAFVSHNISRNNYYSGRKGYDGLGIADEIITVTRPDVVIGGGHPLWNNPQHNMNEGFMSWSLYEQLGSMREYVFVERIQGIDCGEGLNKGAARAVIEGRRLFGLFGGPGGNFEPPVPANDPGHPRMTRATAENPILGDAVTAALNVLARNKKGFFLMAEQGDIDWANHANDYQWMLGTVWDLNEAVKAAVQFVDMPNDDIDWSNTLLIVTADHANSFMRLDPALRLGPGELPAQDCSTGICRYPDGQVAYSAMGHTNELVMLYARGQAADLFEQYRGAIYPGTDIIDNTNIFDVMVRAAGVQAQQTVSSNTR